MQCKEEVSNSSELYLIILRTSSGASDSSNASRTSAVWSALLDSRRVWCETLGMADSIFTKIIKGEIPAHKIYEDNKTIAILDIHPVQPGMTLVITKRQVEDFTELTDEELAALMQTVKKLALRLKQVFPDKKRIGLQIEGLDVPHVHVKLIPINSGAEFRAKPDFSSEPDHETLAQIAKKLAL